MRACLLTPPGNARARAKALIASIAADLNRPLTPAVLTAAIAEVTEALEYDLAADDIERRLLSSKPSLKDAPKT